MVALFGLFDPLEDLSHHAAYATAAHVLNDWDSGVHQLVRVLP
jgi:hypothetical protein